MNANDIFKSGVSTENMDTIFNNHKVSYQDQMYYDDLLNKARKASLIEYYQERLKNEQLSAEESAKIRTKIAQEEARCEQQAAQATAYYKQNLYKNSSREVKMQIRKDEAEKAKREQENLQKIYAQERALIQTSSKDKKEKSKQLKALDEKFNKELSRLKSDERKANNDAYKLQYESQNADFKNLATNIKKLKTDKKEAVAGIADGLMKLDFKAIAASASKTVEMASEQLDDLEEQIKNGDISEEEGRAKQQEIINQKFLAGMQATMSKAVEQLSAAYDQAFKEAEQMLTTYQSHIDARLQGSTKNYDDMMGLVSNNLSVSPYVKTQQVMENMKKAVDQGISYNVEQRAFLNTVADKIANTFDAFDSNLTRLVRLQQADSTAARLGMEASLTKFFNNMFEDTSYLSGLSDSVAAAIIDANSQLDRNQSAEFEYVVQKWLGSLSSLGMSESTITNIAQGLNYLATGDVTSLSSNTSLQTLFAMSSAKAGLEYSDLLLNGLTADNTNKLFESMVEYLKEIAENSDSQVVKAAYGDIFNMSLSDMKAISNLSSSDIANISSNMLSYGGMNNELNWQFSNLSSRVNIAEKLSNLYNNAIFGIASDMVNNPATFAMTKMLDFMDSTGVDIAIPFVNAAGFGLDVNTSVQDIMRLGLGLAQAQMLMGNILGGLGAEGGLDLSSWGGSETTNRGSGLAFTTASRLGGTSGSTYVASGSMSDMKTSSLHSATDDAEKSAEITNKNHKAEYTIADFYKATVGEPATDFVKTRDTLFELVYNNDTNFLSVRDTRTKVEDGFLQTHDTQLHNLLSSGNVVVTLDKNAKVNIDKATLVAAFKEAMGVDEKEDTQNIGDLINGLKDGSIVVKIGNEIGSRLQVDTELSGVSGYVSPINW